MNKLNGAAEGDAKVAGKAHAGGNRDVKAHWGDSLMGLVKKATMDFTGLPLSQQVGDAYVDPLGVEWCNTTTQSLPNEFDFESGPIPIAKGPSPPEVAVITVGAAGAAFDGGFTRGSGLIKEVEFYYSTSFLAEQVAANPNVEYTVPKVTAWTGPAGTGKKLDEMELPFTTGDLIFDFKVVDFKFKGVAKSITFTLPTFDGEFFADLVVDNVSIKGPEGKAAILAAAAMDAEEKFAEIEKMLEKEH